MHAGATLTVDLNAVAANWRLLADRVAPSGAGCAAAVKADAYGLGMREVAPTLFRAGCRIFFVALLDEGLALRRLVPEAEIHVLNGPEPGTEPEYLEHDLIPVLNSLGDIQLWTDLCRWRNQRFPADVHVNTAMSRLGLPADELAILADDPERLDAFDVRYVMSHLSCADEPKNPMNAMQLAAFKEVLGALGGFNASFAGSSGIFLGPEYHFQLARPGVALYGINPTPDSPTPMRQVVSLKGKILQVHTIDTDQAVGYGATFRAQRQSRIATVSVGYGDGYPRSLGNTGFAYFESWRAPVVGRVSMDLITLDVTDVPQDAVHTGALADLIGPLNPVDAVARAAGTIGHEILTNLGPRYNRVYTGGNS